MGKADQEGRWRWRVSHIFWGAMTIFMMGWAFFLGLMAGQGSIGTPEQMDSLRGLTRNLPGMERLAPGEPTPPPREEARLREPELGFYDEVVRGPAGPPPAAPAKPAPAPTQATPATPSSPAAPAAGAAASPQTPAATPAPLPPPRIGPPILGKPEPFRPETAPPIDLPTPSARPTPGTAPAPAPGRPAATPAPVPAAAPAAPQPQPFNPQPQPFRPAPGQVASAPKPAAPAAQPAPARGRFTVQVASLQDEYQARDLVAQLKSGGHAAYLVRVQMEGVGVRYRVRVGPYDDFDRAQGAASRIRLQQTLAAYVTKED